MTKFYSTYVICELCETTFETSWRASYAKIIKRLGIIHSCCVRWLFSNFYAMEIQLMQHTYFTKSK